MNYDPLKKVIQISPEEASRAAAYLLWSMKHIRLTAGLPLDRHERPGCMESPDFAQAGILSAAQCLGLDLGATKPEHIDLRHVG
jgi:hypothetical protein